MSFVKSFFLLFAMLLLSSCSTDDGTDARSHTVIVSLAPYKTFIEDIVGDTIQVKMMVPAGGSPHSFEPSARQVLDASKADIWFQVGEPFEERATEAMQSYGSRMKVVDLRSGIEMISAEEDGHGHAHCPHHGCQDPHIWMSPRRVKIQAETMTKALSQLYPEHAEEYHTALRKLQKELDDLDLDISGILHSMKNKTILVSHPAYSYFCKDYGLEQISIEFEGKEPSPHHLTKVLGKARKSESPFIFVQAQHSPKGSQLIADEIGAEVILLNPLAEDYFTNMREIAKSFAAQ